jgi:hypothetical protein
VIWVVTLFFSGFQFVSGAPLAESSKKNRFHAKQLSRASYHIAFRQDYNNNIYSFELHMCTSFFLVSFPKLNDQMNT